MKKSIFINKIYGITFLLLLCLLLTIFGTLLFNLNLSENKTETYSNKNIVQTADIVMNNGDVDNKISKENGSVPDDAIGLSSEKDLYDFLTEKSGYENSKGYLTGDIIINATKGFVSIFSEGRILDGNGYYIILNSVMKEIEPITLVEGSRGYSGLFIAINRGVLKNIKFTYANEFKYLTDDKKEYGNWFGLVVGKNVGEISNCSLDVKANFTSIQEMYDRTNPNDLERYTSIFGGIASANYGNINNVLVNYHENTTIDIVVKSEMKYISNISVMKYSRTEVSRAGIGGIVGVNESSGSMHNVKVSGNNTEFITSTMGSKTSLKELLWYGAVCTLNIGKIDGIIVKPDFKQLDSYGQINSVGGVLYCGKVTNTILTNKINDNNFQIDNCTDHANFSSYIEKVGVGKIEIDFAKNKIGTIEVFVEANTSENIIYKIYNGTKEYFRLVDEKGKTINKKAIELTDYPEDIVIEFGRLGKIDYNKTADVKIYDGVDLKNNFKLIVSGLATTTLSYDSYYLVNSINNMAIIDAILPNKYYMKFISNCNENNIDYIDENKRIIVPKSSEERLYFDEIIKAEINTINVDSKKWYSSFYAKIGICSDVHNAIDRYKISEDEGEFRTIINTDLNLTKDTPFIGTHITIVGCKGETEVTNKFQFILKIDNTGVKIEDKSSSLPLNQWTLESITYKFTAHDKSSGINKITMNSSILQGTPDGIYSFIMDKNIKYTLKYEDNAGNILEENLIPLIDKIDINNVSSQNIVKKNDGNIITTNYNAGAVTDKILYFTIPITLSKGISSNGKGYFEVYMKSLEPENKYTLNVEQYIKVYESEVVDGGMIEYKIDYETNAEYCFKLISQTSHLSVYYNYGVVRLEYKTILLDNSVLKSENIYKEFDGTKSLPFDLCFYSGYEFGEALKLSASYDNENASDNIIINVNFFQNEGYCYKIDDRINLFGKINKRSIKVRAHDKSINYKENIPKFDYSVENYIDTDNNFSFVLTTDYNTNKNAGNYNIFIDRNIEFQNYSLDKDNYFDGVLKVNKIINTLPNIIDESSYIDLIYNGEEKYILGAYYDIANDIPSLKYDLEITYQRFDGKNYVPCSSPVDAGAYRALIEAPNYVFASPYNELDFYINKNIVVITNGNIELTFNGSLFMVSPTIDFGNINNISVVYNDGDIINAGIYSVTIKYMADENYLYSEKTINVTVNKAELDNFVFENKKYTYNGEEKSIIGIESSLPENFNKEFIKYYNNKAVIPGLYYASCILNDPNFVTRCIYATMVIENGKFFNLVLDDLITDFCGTNIDLNVIGELNGASVRYFNNNQINVGEYIVTAEITKEYYDTLLLSAKLTINKADFKNVFFNNINKIFDGKIAKVEVLGDLPIDTKITFSNNNVCDAGIYPVSARLANPNYNDLIIYSTITISPIAVYLKFSGSTIIQIGEKINLKATYMDINGNICEARLIFGCNIGDIKVGSYKIKAVIDNANYEVVSDSMELEVTFTSSKYRFLVSLVVSAIVIIALFTLVFIIFSKKKLANNK